MTRTALLPFPLPTPSKGIFVTSIFFLFPIFIVFLATKQGIMAYHPEASGTLLIFPATPRDPHLFPSSINKCSFFIFFLISKGIVLKNHQSSDLIYKKENTPHTLAECQFQRSSSTHTLNGLPPNQQNQLKSRDHLL